jgi:hypothetical protein
MIGTKFSSEEVQNDIKIWPFKIIEDKAGRTKISVKD